MADAYTVDIVDNPLLPECRADAIRDVFVASGWDEAYTTVSGNSPDCPP